jgi:hypothetical protein
VFVLKENALLEDHPSCLLKIIKKLVQLFLYMFAKLQLQPFEWFLKYI